MSKLKIAARQGDGKTLKYKNRRDLRRYSLWTENLHIQFLHKLRKHMCVYLLNYLHIEGLAAIKNRTFYSVFQGFQVIE